MQAALLLQDAHSRYPDSEELVARLEKLGYRYRDNRWLTAAEFQKLPEGRIEQAIRDGRVEAGMTAGQVLKSLGQPLSSTRIATAGQVQEVWIYGQSGSSLVLNLTRALPAAESRVTSIARGAK